jgi:hypothetical protein
MLKSGGSAALVQRLNTARIHILTQDCCKIEFDPLASLVGNGAKDW